MVIPAGCAHQVRNGGRGHNTKVAQDFIAPHSVSVCLELLEEVSTSAFETCTASFYHHELYPPR